MDALVAVGATWPAASPGGDAAAGAPARCAFCVSDGDASGTRRLWRRWGRSPGVERCAVDRSLDDATPELRPGPCLCRAEALAALRWIDAPVSGGVAAAKNGTLAAWLGGRREDADRARAFIAAYAGRINYMGHSGSGQTAKSCNQVIVANTIAVWAEMLAYAVGSNGLDPLKFRSSIRWSGSGADSARACGVRSPRGWANGTFSRTLNAQHDQAILGLGCYRHGEVRWACQCRFLRMALNHFKRGIHPKLIALGRGPRDAHRCARAITHWSRACRGGLSVVDDHEVQ